MIVDMDAGFFNGKFQVAYITDADNSIETYYDRSLTVVDSNGAVTYKPTSGAQILNPKFTVVNNNQALSWFQAEMSNEEDWNRYIAEVRYMTADGQHQSMGGSMPTANHKILNSGYGTAVVYPVTEGETNAFYARMYNGGILGNPFKLFETENFVRYYDAALNSSGEFNIAYNNSSVFRGSDDNPVFIETNDLRAASIVVPVNIRIADFYYSERNMRLGEKLPVRMSVQNIGSVPVDAIVIDADGDVIETIPISGGLRTGETTAFEFELSIPSNMDEMTEFVITVMPDGLDDAGMSDNSRVITLV